MKSVEQKKSEFLEAAQRAYRRGLQTGDGGNISVRVPEHDLMIVKPSGVSFIDCNRSNLVITDFNGNVVEGANRPTREALLHGSIYANISHIGAVVHTHAPWSILWSMTRRDLPLVTQHAKLKLGSPVPNLFYDAPVVPTEGVEAIITLLKENLDLRAFILGEHGIVALGETALQAEHNAEFIEETAQISWLHELGKRLVLDDVKQSLVP